MKDKNNHIKNYEILEETSEIFGNSSIVYFKTDFLEYSRYPNFVPYFFKRKFHIGLPSSPLILVKRLYLYEYRIYNNKTHKTEISDLMEDFSVEKIIRL